MNDRQRMMWEIQIYGFALVETNLFLDTHPDDAKAIAFFNETKAKRDAAVAEYEKNYGPITACGMTYQKRFTWVDDPWPWEYGATTPYSEMGVGK